MRLPLIEPHLSTENIEAYYVLKTTNQPYTSDTESIITERIKELGLMCVL